MYGIEKILKYDDDIQKRLNRENQYDNERNGRSKTTFKSNSSISCGTKALKTYSATRKLWRVFYIFVTSEHILTT
jgi:hypothetical protein